jgi:hypothetical protein
MSGTNPLSSPALRSPAVLDDPSAVLLDQSVVATPLAFLSKDCKKHTHNCCLSECAACRGALFSVCMHMFSAQELDGNQHHQLQKQDEQKKANNPNGKRHTSLDFSQLPHRPPHHPARLQTEPIKNYRGKRAGTKEDRTQAEAQSKNNPEC